MEKKKNNLIQFTKHYTVKFYFLCDTVFVSQDVLNKLLNNAHDGLYLSNGRMVTLYIYIVVNKIQKKIRH